jgi:hypothetical protein
MKIVQALGFGFAFAVLSTGAGFGCSGDSTPASTGSSTGTGTPGPGSGSMSGTAASGSTASGTTVSGSFATSGTMPTSGTVDTSGTMAASGTMDTSGTMAASGTMMMSGSMAGSGTADAGGGAPPTVAEVKAMCVKNAGTPTFTPAQFCVLFEGTCAAHIIKTADLGNMEAGCETAYGALAATAQACRSQHVCNASGGGALLATHCPHAQGWKTATVQPGGPCM